MDDPLTTLRRARADLDKAISALASEPRNSKREPWANTPERNALIDGLAKDIVSSWPRPITTLELAECLAMNGSVPLSVATLRLQVLPRLRDAAGTWSAAHYDRGAKRYTAQPVL